ncbi:MAG TPA: hypothetical protein VGO62_20810, partial [Myxococcota bacterium]
MTPIAPTVSLWLSPVDDDGPLDHALALLDGAERARAARFARAEDRGAYVCAHALARIAVADALGV